MTDFLQVNDWPQFQHYGNRRSPPWVKLHRDLLDDPRWANLSDSSARAFIELTLLASHSPKGIIDSHQPSTLASLEMLASRTRQAGKERFSVS